MKIVFWPAITDEKLDASVSGDVLTINGEKFDFSPIGEGMQLPGAAVGNFWFVNYPITRIEGELTVTLKLPVSWDTPENVRSPVNPLYTVVKRGKVKLPDTSPEKVETPIIEIKEGQTNGPEPTKAN